MAIISDLTFEQVNEAAIADSTIGQAIFSLSGDAIMLDVKKLCGDAYTALSNEGVLELAYKLRRILGIAQTAVNEDLATSPDEELTSFPAFSFGFPSEEGLVPVTQTTTFNIPLGINTIKGTN